MLTKALSKSILKPNNLALNQSNKLAAVSQSVRLAGSSPVWTKDDPKVVQSLIEELSLQQMESDKTVVPWFLNNMPAAYFKQVDEHIRKQHLKAVAAFNDISKSDLTLKIETKGADGSSTVTNMNSDPKIDFMIQNIKGMTVPANSTLANVKIFQSNDHQLALQMFSYISNKNSGERATVADGQAILATASEIRGGLHTGNSRYPRDSPLFTEESLKEYFNLCTPSYCKNGNPRRFLIQRKLYESVRMTDKVAVHVEKAEEDSVNSWFTIAAANVLPDVMFRLAANMLHSLKFTVVRSHMDRIEDPENSTPELPGFVTMLRMCVATDMSKPGMAENIRTAISALKRAKWYDQETVDLGLNRRPELGLDRAEVVTCLCSLIHGPLCKQNSHAYSSIKAIVSTVDSDRRFVSIASSIADLFLDKFSPDGPITPSEYARRERELRDKIEYAQPENPKVDPKRVIDAKVVLNKMLDAVTCTLRTNFYNADRYALSLRLDPIIMATDGMGERPDRPLPFGLYFAHGRHFNAFHNRFRDVARGGLRVVTPPNADMYVSESSKHFDEVYNLSYAQQLKNKDIPEGGAKSVIILNTPNIRPDARFFAIRKSIRAFCDSCFDLMVKDSVSGLVDYLKKDELLYFGPDEQVIPSDVDWITRRAAQRGYPIPAAFMSSKPGPGFNHKEFGVTSEGVVVFMDVALRKALNIDPKTQPFSVKITGGPDGDVAGNLMKILIRDYAKTAKIVGVADGFGVAEDPNGLNHEEIMRLFNAGLPINSFNKAKLSKEGSVFDASTDEGAARRDSMVFRVKADCFIPGGGRPNTINKDNWQNFLDANGVPTSKLIVEGANLFNTKDARNSFHTKGIAVVKDSSANKCGVMTSSYEVQAGMLLTKEEFMSNKKELAADVLVKLRQAAMSEAELLFREYANYPGSLPEFSERISNAINKVTDAIMTHLEQVQPNDPLFKHLMPLIKDNLPVKLAELAWDRVPSRFPVQYQRCTIASTLASRLVYKEGIHFIEAQPEGRLAERAFAYYTESCRIRDLVAELEKKDLGVSTTQKSEILHLLSKGGTRTALDIF